MKVERSKEWWTNKARQEGNSEVGAGVGLDVHSCGDMTATRCGCSICAVNACERCRVATSEPI